MSGKTLHGPTKISAAIAIVAVIVAVGAVGWALSVALRQPDDVLASDSTTSVEIREGEVGQSVRLNTVAKWTPQPVGINRAVGVVTGIEAAPGTMVSAGTALYDVNLRPVSIAQGSTPSFRSISLGSKGADVTQLQHMLSELGFYGGVEDGSVEVLTDKAIKAWQSSLDLEPTGTVLAGDIIFVPDLPTRISINAQSVFLGATMSGGEPAIDSFPTEPAFSIAVTENQAESAPADTEVHISSPTGSTWNALVSAQRPDGQSGGIVVTLKGVDDQSICGAECSSVPLDGDSLLPSELIVLPSTKGLIVPTSALRTDASGAVHVVDLKGHRKPVEVVASSNGMSVITGVEAGARVRIPAPAEGK
jgi:peptidoglycan hydrolase-like protein with peptidoglycan-binding domain